MMTRLVSWLFFATLALVALLLIAPGFIDWNRHKDFLVSELSAIVGQEVRIDGDVSLRLLPNPHVSIEKVTIGADGADRYLVSITALEARMSMEKLLHGKFEIDHIHVQDPTILMVVGIQGSNWKNVWVSPIDKGAIRDGNIVLRQLSASNARFIYRNELTAQQWQTQNINFTLASENLAGPYQLRGDMIYGAAPLTFTLSTQPRNAQGSLPFSLEVLPIEQLPQIKAAGLFSPFSPMPLSMNVQTHAGRPIDLLSPFKELMKNVAHIDALNDKGEADFTLEISSDQIAFSDIKINAESGATLAGAITYIPTRRIANSDVTLTQPGRYWLSFKGENDLARSQHYGDVLLKAEDASKLVPHAPGLSLEVSGKLAYTTQDDWEVTAATLSFPAWPTAELQGRIQRTAGQTVFNLAAPTGHLRDLTLSGQLGESMAAEGKATLNGKFVDLKLSGSPLRPDITADLSKVTPQDMLTFLKAGADPFSLQGGVASFKGQLDLQAAALDAVVVGVLTLSPEKVKIKNFTPHQLQKSLLDFEAVPEDLAAQLLASARADTGIFTGQAVTIDLPISPQTAWHLKKVAYPGGDFDLAVEQGRVAVTVTASDESKVAYTATLPLDEKEMPVERTRAFILERHPPQPDIDTKAAVGDIINRLEDAVVDEVAMPPQPNSPLPEVDVPPAPELPADVPLEVEAVPEPVAAFPDEIFPVETP